MLSKLKLYLKKIETKQNYNFSLVLLLSKQSIKRICMNKGVQKSELPIQYVTLSKAQTDSLRHEMVMKTSQYLTNDNASNKKNSNIISDKNEQKSVFIRKTALERTISVYQWRFKTCYPIVKPLKITVKSFTNQSRQKRTLLKKHSNGGPFEIWNLDENLLQLSIITEKIITNLNEITTMPLPQLFYLLKEMLVGFECLIDIFGLFEPTQGMIAVNNQNQWRFWISEDFASNSKKESNITEPEFILKIINMIQLRMPNSRIGNKFFEEIRNMPIKTLTFLNLLDMTNIFTSFNKINVAKKFVLPPNKVDNSLSSIGKKQSHFHSINNKTFSISNHNHSDKNLADHIIEKKPQGIIQSMASFQNPLVANHHKNQNSNIKKFQTMKSLNERSFNLTRKKQNSIIGSFKNNLQVKKQKDTKTHMKISQLYFAQTLSKNNIEKRASFLFNSDNKPNHNLQDSIKQISQTCKVSKQALQIGSARNTISYNIGVLQQNRDIKNFRAFSPKIQKQQKKERKISFQIETNNNKDSFSRFSKNPFESNTKPHQKTRKNSYYDYERPINKQAFSQSPQKSSRKQLLEQPKINKFELVKVKQNSAHRQNTHIRDRKYSQQVPKIRSLDEFAKKNKKMCESNVLGQNEQKRHQPYGNLKMKDIANHSRNATITGMAFGNVQNIDRDRNNINNDIYNGRFEEIMKSVKCNKSLQEENQSEMQDEFSPLDHNNNITKLKRRATAFQMIRQQPFFHSPKQHEDLILQNNIKPIVRVSNANNQTAETLNKSELLVVKGSGHQSNSCSNPLMQQSDNSQQNSAKSPLLSINRYKGPIGESNLSIFSCRTHQPEKNREINGRSNNKDRYMTTSGDCFKNSDSSEEFLKSNNWNKKISGLFSDVASIKVLKESNHFGDQLDVFEKEYLKDVKLQKLDKFGKDIKCSIIETDEGQFLNAPTKAYHNKSFSLIGQVKEEPYENDPSYLQYSTSMICQSKHQLEERSILHSVQPVNQLEKSMRACESFQQQIEIDKEENACNNQKNKPCNGGFNFETQLYKIVNN